MSGFVPLNTLPLFGGLGEPTAVQEPELEKKEAVLEKHADGNRVWLDPLRDHLKEIYASRVSTRGIAHAYVTADDARKLMKWNSKLAPPPGTSMNAMGALFRTRGWRKLRTNDEYKSTTPGSHGNRLDCWVWLPESQH